MKRHDEQLQTQGIRCNGSSDFYTEAKQLYPELKRLQEETSRRRTALFRGGGRDPELRDAYYAAKRERQAFVGQLVGRHREEVESVSKDRLALEMELHSARRRGDENTESLERAVRAAKRRESRVSTALRWVHNPERFRPPKPPSPLARAPRISTEKRKQMLCDQNGRCAICGKEFGDISATLLDHSHTTGAIRGLLCNGCNQVVAWGGDNPIGMRERANQIEATKRRIAGWNEEWSRELAVPTGPFRAMPWKSETDKQADRQVWIARLETCCAVYERQNGACAWCGSEIPQPQRKRRLDRPWGGGRGHMERALEGDMLMLRHRQQDTLHIICGRCRRLRIPRLLMGGYPERLRRAADYLEHPPAECPSGQQ